MLADRNAVARGTGSAITVDLDKETPRIAPSCGRDQAYDFEQRAAARKLRDDHRVPPCWM